MFFDQPRPLDKNNRFFWVDERVFPTAVDWQTNAPKDGMPAENTYSVEAMRALDTHRTPIQKQPEMLLCLVGISRRYYLGDEVYPTYLHDDDRDIDLFNLIRALNPTKVKIGSRPRVAHELPLLTMTANRVIEMEDPAAPTDSSGVPSTIEWSSLDFANEVGASDQGAATPEVPPPEDAPTASAPEVGQAKEVASTDPFAATESCKRGRDGADVNAPTKGTAVSGDLESKNASFASAVGSLESIYRPEWGVADGSMLDTPEACQDLVDHVAPRGGNGVAAATEVRTRGQVVEEEAEAGMKKAAEDKSVGLSQELEDMRARFSDLQVSNEHLSQQVATLQEQVSREEKLKAAFEEFKRYEDNRVEQRCAEMDARLDALSIDFDEELYPHMLTAIAGRRWVIGRGLRLAIMKCGESLKLRQAFANVVFAGIAKGMSEGLRHGVEHGQAQLSLESIEAYDPEAEAKYVTALQALKDLKYPLVDQLEGLKDAPMDVIMAALCLESDTGDDAPQHVRDLHTSSSQLTIHVYPEVRDPMNPWACKEEMLLVDAIAANISRAEKKKKCRIVCRTHGVASVHHARSNDVPVSVPTVVPQGLALLLADAATQTKFEEDA
nr:putative transposase (putative), gypsy type [Tanacetum cinerariifolium]